MPKIPRDLSSRELCEALKVYGYSITRQTGSHIRLTRISENTEHNLTVPAHDPIKIGTLNNIFKDVSVHLNITKEALISSLFRQNVKMQDLTP